MTDYEIRLLEDYAEAKIRKHPELESEINDLVRLCKDEIAEGSSKTHEIELCMESIFQLAHPLYDGK